MTAVNFKLEFDRVEALGRAEMKAARADVIALLSQAEDRLALLRASGIHVWLELPTRRGAPLQESKLVSNWQFSL